MTKLKTLKDFERERIVLYDNIDMKKKGKIVPTHCSKCETFGYPLCKFCTPRKEWLKWYKSRTGTDYKNVEELKIIYELKAEAIKWVKYIKENGGAVTDENFLLKFFNITGEDLK